MPYLDLGLPPGVFANGTQYQARGRWRLAHLVRWLAGAMRPVGGWAQHSSSAVTGAARSIITWKDNSNNALIGIGTHNHWYAMSRSGVLTDITPAGFTSGRADATVGGGYGQGLYGVGTYGTPRPDTVLVQDATVWTQDTWGEHLVGMNADDGKAYEWDLNTANDGVAISGAPTGRALIVTAERILMILGANGDPRNVTWSDAEDNTNWTPSAISLAGDFNLQTPGRLMCGKRLTGETGLWTDTDFWTGVFTASQPAYVFTRKGSGCGAISQQAVAAVDTTAAWMSQSGFWTYNGYVQPLECEVQDYVFGNLNVQQASKISAVHNSDFGEVWWFYPSADSNEIDRYVVWNYRENHWTLGEVSRLCGTGRGAFSYPLMVDSSGIVWEHETGFTYTGAEVPSATTGPIQPGQGDNVVYATRLVADENTMGDVEVFFGGRFYPNADFINFGSYQLTSTPTDVRFCARQLEMTIRGDNTTDWRWGNPRLELRAGGRR